MGTKTLRHTCVISLWKKLRFVNKKPFEALLYKKRKQVEWILILVEQERF
jgi:hypothetical protein